MKNYLENRLFNNVKVLKVLLNFLKAIKMRCFKEKADTAAAKIRADNKQELVKLEKKKHREKKQNIINSFTLKYRLLIRKDNKKSLKLKYLIN